MQSPEKTAKTLLAFLVFAAVFLDFWSYSRHFYQEPAVYTDVLLGTASAPNQYRVGAVRLASFVARHGHMGLRHAMALLDVLSALLAVYVLYALLCRSSAYRAADKPMRWFASAAFLVLVSYDLTWLTWYQRPETLPSAALVVAALWLLTGRASASRPLPALAISGGLLLFSAAQALVRADVAVALNLGVLLVCLTRKGGDLSLPRGAMAATALLGIALSGGMQLYLMRAYPGASYGSTPVVQLALNLSSPLRMVPFLLFMLPWAWALQYLLRRRITPAGPDTALLLGSAVFLLLWFVLGKIDEVRIFLPFALGLAPLTVQAVLHQASRPG